MSQTNMQSYGEFLKKVFAIAVPVACQNLLTTTGSMVDTIMLGSIGETSVGAVGLCAQFSSLMLSCYWGILGGGILFFSQYWGNKDEAGLKRSYGMMISILLVISCIFGSLAVFFPNTVMGIYTDKEIYREIGVKYLRIIGFAYPLQVFSVGVSGLLRSTEEVRIPLVASIASVLSNIFLNWVFIFGNLGAKAMGVEGAALATLIAAFVNVFTLLLFARIKKLHFLFTLKDHFAWSKESLKLFYTKCFPIILNELALGGSNLIINIVLGRQAVEAIAALAVFRTIEGLVVAFFSGFSSAASVLVGNRVGAGKHDEAHLIANRCVYLCAGTIFIVCACIIMVHTPLLHLMGLSSASFEYATQMLLVYCIIAVLRMSNWISNDICRASGDAITGTCFEIGFMYVLNIPLLCLGGLVWHLPFLIVFIFSYIDEPVRFVLMQFHIHSGGWIRPVTKEGMEALKEFRSRHPLKLFWTRMGIKKELW